MHFYDDEALAIQCAACGDYVIAAEVDRNFGRGDVCKECADDIRADFATEGRPCPGTRAADVERIIRDTPV